MSILSLQILALVKRGYDTNHNYLGVNPPLAPPPPNPPLTPPRRGGEVRREQRKKKPRV
ncbi:MAG: hypothetical protein F6K48_09500 [Okeania sp. SIO3H1]|nr:hypothetical protein [Okeania sp. SIO3H1]